jgi:SAM-dependent methyltransferase
MVVALGRETAALKHITDGVRVGGDALHLPFAAQSFDLVFCQCVLLWVGNVAATAHEIYRILQPGGVLIAIEPDYDGLIEYPPEIVTRDLWLAALARVGAEARIGRILPGLLAAAGFQVKVNLLDEVVAAPPTRFEFLRTLPLTVEETVVLRQIENTAANLGGEWAQVAHLPFVLVTAVKP